MRGVKLQPSDEQRRTARAMAGYGVPHDQIAIFLEIDAKTLRKHYRVDLDRGMIEANVKVAQTLFALATVDKNVAAAIFWMKARAGWREKVDVHQTGRLTLEELVLNSMGKQLPRRDHTRVEANQGTTARRWIEGG